MTRRKADRLPAVNPAEAFRVNLWGAQHALACAEAGDPNSLETALNRGTARIHAIAALRLLPPETLERVLAKDAPE